MCPPLSLQAAAASFEVQALPQPPSSGHEVKVAVGRVNQAELEGLQPGLRWGGGTVSLSGGNFLYEIPGQDLYAIGALASVELLI